jgi:hypothetical protein
MSVYGGDHDLILDGRADQRALQLDSWKLRIGLARERS